METNFWSREGTIPSRESVLAGTRVSFSSEEEEERRPKIREMKGVALIRIWALLLY